MPHRIIPAIMSGGSGTRLWPVSTDAKPKQFHALISDAPLIAETLRRVEGQTPALSFAPPMLLANIAHADLIDEAVSAIGAEPAAIVLEPTPRNTAAAAAVAAKLASELEPGALVLLLPADHVIENRAAFLDAVARAAPFARERIVTFGIAPTRPETGYGYIRRGALLGDGVFNIDSFREKPNAATAEEYLADGGYSWNAGMFLFAPQVMLEEFSASPKIREHALAALQKAKRKGKRILLDADAFSSAPSEPVDIAVMEKTQRAAVAPCDIGWADIGSWSEIWRLSERDSAGNAIYGASATIDAANNLLRSEGPKICVAGVQDLIVIATPDAVLILPRDRAQDVKELRELALKKP